MESPAVYCVCLRSALDRLKYLDDTEIADDGIKRETDASLIDCSLRIHLQVALFGDK